MDDAPAAAGPNPTANPQDPQREAEETPPTFILSGIAGVGLIVWSLILATIVGLQEPVGGLERLGILLVALGGAALVGWAGVLYGRSERASSSGTTTNERTS